MNRSSSLQTIQSFFNFAGKRLRKRTEAQPPVPPQLMFAWFFYALESILLPLKYIITDEQDFSWLLLNYITHAISSAIVLVIMVVLIILYCFRRKIAKTERIKRFVQVLVLCNILLKFLFYDLNASKKEYQFVCIIEVVFVSYWISLFWSSFLQSFVIFGCYLLYGTLSNLIGRHPQTLLIVQYFLAMIPLFIALFYQTTMIGLKENSRKLSLMQQKRLWDDHLKNLPDLVLIIDQDRQVIYRNQAYCKLADEEGLQNNTPDLLSRIPHLRLKDNDLAFKTWFKDMLRTTGEFTDLASSYTQNLFQTQTSNRRTWKLDQPLNIEAKLRTSGRKGKYSTYALNIDLGVLISILSRNMDSYSNTLKDKVLILYGKMHKYDDTQNSYEIKISVSKEGEQKVLVIMLTETTHRDKVLKLEEVSEFKNRLLGSFSHELRTPLNGNMNFLVTALEDTGISDFCKERLIEPALKCSQLLMYLVNDILDYSQMATNTLTLNFSKQDLDCAIYEVIDVVKTQANQKNIKLNVIKDPRAPKALRTDFQRLKQVLVNLFRNALNKTFSGEILLEITSSEQFPNIFKFTVSDTGIEIPVEEQEVIKNLVLRSITKERSIRDPAKDPSGGYLCLKLATSIAELLSPNGYGGLRFERQDGKGSVYHFYVEDRDDGLDHMDIDISHLNGAKKDFSIKESQFSRQSTFKKPSAVKTRFKLNFNKLNSGVSSMVEFNNNEEQSPQSSQSFDSKKGRILRGANEENNPLSDRHLIPYTAHATKLHLLTRKDDLTMRRMISTEMRTPVIEEIKTCECDGALVVDDDAFNILSLGAILKSLGLKYEEAYNGQLALDKILAKKPCCENCHLYSIIFMDCNMPVKDGYETTIELRKLMNERVLPRIPIVACTAYIIDYQASKCKECGMDEYLSKPVNKKLLQEILKKREKLIC